MGTRRLLGNSRLLVGLDGEGGKDVKGNQDRKKPVWNRTRMIRPERGIEIVVGSLCCRWEKVKVARGNAGGRNRHAKLKHADLYELHIGTVPLSIFQRQGSCWEPLGNQSTLLVENRVRLILVGPPGDICNLVRLSLSNSNVTCHICWLALCQKNMNSSIRVCSSSGPKSPIFSSSEYHRSGIKVGFKALTR